MLLRSMQNTRRELADAKAENDALRDDVAAGRRRLHIKAVCNMIGMKPPPPPAWIMQPPRLADTAERDYFTLREADPAMPKQLEGASSNGDADGVAYRWATRPDIVSNTHAGRSINA